MSEIGKFFLTKSSRGQRPQPNGVGWVAVARCHVQISNGRYSDGDSAYKDSRTARAWRRVRL
jgi:hypothetical protein